MKHQFGDLYSQYYDLLYSDKDYKGEVKYIDGLIKEYVPHAKTLLDMGCGTGKHAQMLCDSGYLVHGVDLSEDMLKIAEKRVDGREGKLSFSYSDVKDLQLDKKFDVITSLFHVMSYQAGNEDVLEMLGTAMKHLGPNGVFIFDFWYGPAVLTDLPQVRVKRLENDNMKVTRIAEPVLFPNQSLVDVNYDVFIEDKKNNSILEQTEVHRMRYFFETELASMCEESEFKVIKKYSWMSSDEPSFKSWNVVWVITPR